MGKVTEQFLQMEGVIEELKEENGELKKKTDELNAEADHLHDLMTARGRKINQLVIEFKKLQEENERLQKDLKDSKWI